MSESKPFCSVIAATEREPTYGCPCCKHRTLRGRGGGFEICQVCYWQDDGQDEHDADIVRGGPNGELSLREARDNYRRFQASDPRFVAHVRAPLPEEQVAGEAIPGIIKPVNELTAAEVQAYPVWEYNLSHEDELPDETFVQPIYVLPVEHLDHRVIGTQVTLANGERLWSIIGNVDVRNAEATEQFLTISLDRGGERFFLARYFDVDHATSGPHALAEFLGLPIAEVFPISYDLAQHVIGDAAVLKGQIPAAPRVRLSRDQIISLAVRSSSPTSK